jgi:dolichol-phosphate mannosyltransferase
MPEITVIVPVLNEAGNVLPLAREVVAALGSRDFELVFVDDGSTDGTWAQIQAAQAQDARVRGWRHPRRLGQSAALWTGLERTTGPVVATLDGDLQNDPADLPRLLGLLAEADFVLGVRRRRRDNWTRRLSTQVAHGARRLVLGVDFEDAGCAARVFKRSVLCAVFPFDGLHRFLPLLVAGGGFRVQEAPVNHRPRHAGRSKYGVWNRLGRGIVDLLAVAWYQRRRLKPVASTDLLASRTGPVPPGGRP